MEWRIYWLLVQWASLARNQDNVSVWSAMSTHRLLVQWASTINLHLSMLVQYKVNDIIISSKCTFFCQWYCCKIVHLPLNNNHPRIIVHSESDVMSLLYIINSGYIINISVRKVMADFLNPLTDYILHIQIAQKSEMWSFFKEHHIPSVTNTSRYFRLVISNIFLV